MLVSEFTKIVRENESLPMLFQHNDGEVVGGGYHVTEIKNVSVETIDCGNSIHDWKEVVVQVWLPEGAKESDPHMSAGKFMKIWDTVDHRLALVQDAEIKIEYGDERFITANYQVGGLKQTSEGLVVDMQPQQTLCKPREILVPLNAAGELVLDMVGGNSESCCTPSNPTACC